MINKPKTSEYNQGMQVSQLTEQPIPGRVVQSVTCLATDACLTADPGVGSWPRPVLFFCGE